MQTNPILVPRVRSITRTRTRRVTEPSRCVTSIIDVATNPSATTPTERNAALDTAPTIDRQSWISTLAKADPATLLDEWNRMQLEHRPDYRMLRPPEIGLVMVRGRAGGVGDRFNLGEMTVTRCAVRLANGTTGVSYRGGRDKDAAEVAAVLDGLLQQPGSHPGASAIVERLEETLIARRAEQARRSGATKVQFFTMTRTREDRK